MKRCIITPTYQGHFVYIEVYLKSMKKYLKDKTFPIYFVIEKKECHQFERLIKPYKELLNIHVLCLEDIFKAYQIKLTPAQAMKKYGRLSFQTLKKLYSALFIDCDQFLFLDSESILIADTNMDQLFDSYFANPTFLISQLSTRPEEYKDEFTYYYVETVSRILGDEPQYWCIESYTWFYEMRILKDMIDKYGSIIEIIDSIQLEGEFEDLEGLLEALFYYQYLSSNYQLYGYRRIITEQEFEKKQGIEEYKKFMEQFNESDVWLGGYLEMFPRFVNKNNYRAFRQILIDNNCQIIRMDRNFHNKKWTRKMVKEAGIKILASSQDNSFTRQFINYKTRMKEKSKAFLCKINPVYCLCNYIYHDSWYRYGSIKKEIDLLRKEMKEFERKYDEYEAKNKEIER